MKTDCDPRLKLLEDLLADFQTLSVELGGEQGRGLEKACDIIIARMQHIRELYLVM
jgi:hypothetical protein